MKKNRNKAITLIALVITIIVLLILAGVTISTLSGENGLLNRAKTAKETSQNASIEENTTLADYETKIDEYINSDRSLELYDVIFEGTFEQGTTKSLNYDITKYKKIGIRMSFNDSSSSGGYSPMQYFYDFDFKNATSEQNKLFFSYLTSNSSWWIEGKIYFPSPMQVTNSLAAASGYSNLKIVILGFKD